MKRPLVLSYAGCDTCRKALKWLKERKIEVEVRPIVDAPPSRSKLVSWIPASGLPVRKWLNTSGQSYRAMGKARVDEATDDQLVSSLVADGKLVKRPVLVLASGTVLVGFKETEWESALG
jgi:arsenate reductase